MKPRAACGSFSRQRVSSTRARRAFEAATGPIFRLNALCGTVSSRGDILLVDYTVPPTDAACRIAGVAVAQFLVEGVERAGVLAA